MASSKPAGLPVAITGKEETELDWEKTCETKNLPNITVQQGPNISVKTEK